MAYDGLSSQGVITYSERFLYANENVDQETQYKRAYFNIVVLHELAH
jgi:aminopeptidase N